ncbi:hypothetical protein AX15_002917 [Amanita polypyramis BW_CC]|nr:hypothetical protein AX15_002917 [Amanita polypyramis BW_CC]
MPKARRRKTPVTDNSIFQHGLPSSKYTRATIRQFHVLLKQRTHLLGEPSNKTTEHALTNIDRELGKLGGLEVYQRMSVAGQDNERGGGSEKVLIYWLRDLGMDRQHTNFPGMKLGLLEVGALKPDNYRTCSSWLECTPIDLRSRHPSIKEQNFLLLDKEENSEKWDFISLSLVLNFVPKPSDRGEMLKLAFSFLKAEGYLFLAVSLGFFGIKYFFLN